jgi:hypothetical protein
LQLDLLIRLVESLLTVVAFILAGHLCCLSSGITFP